MFSVFGAAVLLVTQPLGNEENREIEALVAQATNGLAAAADREKLLEQRIHLCRAALKVEDWPSYVGEQVKADPLLGERVEIIEHCMFYIHGKQDVLEQVIAEDKALLRGPATRPARRGSPRSQR